MKTCKRCKEAKHPSQFYKLKTMKDGLNAECKECTKDRQRIRRIQNPDRAREIDRKKYLNRKSKALQWCREYKEKHKDNPEYIRRRKANYAMGNAVRDGRLAKPDRCEACGNAGRIEGHHPDYDKPLEVNWLCSPCHRRVHYPISP